MEFGVCGPLQVADGDRAIEIPAGRQRSLLATLLRANQVVSTDQLRAQAGKVRMTTHLAHSALDRGEPYGWPRRGFSGAYSGGVVAK